jgi:hypothetical protein
MNLQGKEIHNKHRQTYLGQRSRRPRLCCCPGINHPWMRRSGRAGLQEIGIAVELNGDCCLLNHGVKRRVEWASVVGDKIHKKRMVNGDLGGRREEEGRRELTGTPHDESPSRAAEREIGSNLFLNDFGG